MLKKFAKDISIYGSGDFVFKIIAFVFFIIYARFLSVEDFGLMTLVVTVVNVLVMISNVGLNNAISRYYYDKHTLEEQRPSLVSTGLTIQTLVTVGLTLLVIIGLYPFQEAIQKEYGITYLLFVLALLGAIPTQLIQYALDVIRMHFKPLRFTITSFLKNLLGALIATILLVYTDLKVTGYFMGLLIGLTVAVPISLWMIRKDLSFNFNKKLARNLTVFGYPFIFANVAYWLLSSIDRWMIVEISNKEELGLYAIGFRISQVIGFLSSAFGQAWSPYSIKLYAENPDYIRIVSQILTYLSLVLVLAAISISIFSAEILMVTTPKEYWPAANSLGIIVIGLCFQGTTQITVYGIAIEKKTYLITLGSWLTVILNFGLNYWLINKYNGAFGASLATMFSFLFMTLFYLFHTQKLHPLKLEKKKLLVLFASIFVIVPTTIYINSLDWTFLTLLYKTLLLGLFISTVFITKVIDVKQLKNILKVKFS
ncbi:oligosaccharide flippase family protein [uncultured Microscilla sp.]|uniref:oligosaccharide flippase family protein n=1 Tax=uncultured Microscilla sp. TaxID=432653 RepID=UPI00260AD17B|nr:oligosaccharide flippase family protein [uncultured Microscilla sp.]